MPELLDEKEARVIGCLIEKSIVTPDQYPLTLNALNSACNQKSSRDPVMTLSQGEVLHTIRALEAKHLVRTEENFKGRADKYSQRLCNTRYGELQLTPAQVAVVCLLLLRGAQTPGELRARSGRLHTFADNAEVVATLDELIDREAGALAVRLPRTPGRKDSEYMHLFYGPVDTAAYAEESRAAPAASKPSAVSGRDAVAGLAERVERLEEEVSQLKEQLGITSES
ncbi:MAG: YceH family protein [Pseudomonadota bacterium]